MYVCGGEEDSLILANGEVYDPQEDIWTEMNASMSTPRCEFGMCAHDGFLYAFGGWVGEDIGGSIERYDTVTDRWEKYWNTWTVLILSVKWGSFTRFKCI